MFCKAFWLAYSFDWVVVVDCTYVFGIWNSVFVTWDVAFCTLDVVSVHLKKNIVFAFVYFGFTLLKAVPFAFSVAKCMSTCQRVCLVVTNISNAHFIPSKIPRRPTPNWEIIHCFPVCAHFVNESAPWELGQRAACQLAAFVSNYSSLFFLCFLLFQPPW